MAFETLSVIGTLQPKGSFPFGPLVSVNCKGFMAFLTGQRLFSIVVTRFTVSSYVLYMGPMRKFYSFVKVP